MTLESIFAPLALYVLGPFVIGSVGFMCFRALGAIKNKKPLMSAEGMIDCETRPYSYIFYVIFWILFAIMFSAVTLGWIFLMIVRLAF